MKGSTRKQKVRYRFDALGRRVERNFGFGKSRTKFSYDSFGNPTNANFPTRYQFTGREFDNFSGLQYSRARWYNPSIGRFISEDPIGFAGGDVNLFGYVFNRPLAHIDPYGLDVNWDQQLWRAQQDLIEAAALTIRLGVGFGDNVTWGTSRMFRDFQGIDDPTIHCTWEYELGEYIGMAAQTVAGGLGGFRAAGAKGAGKEFSHWIPKRSGGGRSMFNGNYVPIAEHALSDPYRYRFMPRYWKESNPLPSKLVQQWRRIPKVYKGGAVGAGSGALSSVSQRCECR